MVQKRPAPGQSKQRSYFPGRKERLTCKSRRKKFKKRQLLCKLSPRCRSHTIHVCLLTYWLVDSTCERQVACPRAAVPSETSHVKSSPSSHTLSSFQAERQELVQPAPSSAENSQHRISAETVLTMFSTSLRLPTPDTIHSSKPCSNQHHLMEPPALTTTDIYPQTTLLRLFGPPWF